MAAVIMAKVHWKVQKSDVGSVPVTFVITGLFHTGRHTVSKETYYSDLCHDKLGCSIYWCSLLSI